MFSWSFGIRVSRVFNCSGFESRVFWFVRDSSSGSRVSWFVVPAPTSGVRGVQGNLAHMKTPTPPGPI